MSMFSDSLSFSANTDGDEPSGTPVNIVSLCAPCCFNTRPHVPASFILRALTSIFVRNYRFPGPSKLAIPRTVSFQIQLTNLAAVGSPLCDTPPFSDFSFCSSLIPVAVCLISQPRSYVSFNRAYRQSSNPFHPPEAPIAVWELDGWWQTPEPVADGGSFMTVITVVLSGVIVAGFLIYRCGCV